MVKGSTVLDMHNIPEAEYLLFQKARKIATSGIKLTELTEYQEKILHAASIRMSERIFDLLTQQIEACFCRGNSMATAQFKKRLIWFLQELRKESAMWIEADRIEVEQGEEHVDKFFQTQPMHFSEESWDKLENEIMQDYIQHLRENGKLDDWLKKPS